MESGTVFQGHRSEHRLCLGLGAAPRLGWHLRLSQGDQDWNVPHYYRDPDDARSIGKQRITSRITDYIQAIPEQRFARIRAYGRINA
jgi:replication fork clamp-binding protein CrfC